MQLRLDDEHFRDSTAAGLVLHRQVISHRHEQLVVGIRVQLILLHGPVDGPEGRLLLRVESAAGTVQHQSAVPLRLRAHRHVHTVIGSVVVSARVHVQLLRMIVKYYVDDILVAPGDLQSVLLVYRNHVVGPTKLPHSRQVHQHHSGIDAQLAVIRMFGESVVPAGVGILVFRAEGRQLARVHFLELVPDLLRWRQKQSVRVHVEHRVRVVQHSLKYIKTL